MLGPIFSAFSGLKKATTRLQNSANNVYNLQTSGFKKGGLNNVDNKAGTISNELWASIDEALNTHINTKIVVNGEEDLATLAVISMVKIGAKVIYGMPDKGMVVVDVNQQEKKRANSFLKRMLVD